MDSINDKDAKERFKSVLDKVCDDRKPIRISKRDGKDAVLISADAYDSMNETLYLLSNPANAKHLLESIVQAERGELIEQEIPKV